jgi:hypothetical protein
MNVYQLRIIHSRGEGRREFATLNDKRTDAKFSDQCGTGKPLLNWHELELFFDNPKDPKADVMGFGLNFVFNERAGEILEPILKADGEMLPVRIKGQSGQYYLYNCTTVIDVLDQKRSMWIHYKESQHFQHKFPARRRIEVPAFHSSRLKKTNLFKYPEGMSSVYVVERTGDHGVGEFKALFEHHGLTGLHFDLLWSGKDGPARQRYMKSIPDEHDPFHYCAFDGRPWRFNKTKMGKTRK